MMDASTPSAVTIGQELNRYMSEAELRGGMDREHVQTLVWRLLTARSETAADALALTAWAEGLLTDTLQRMHDDDPDVPDLTDLVAICLGLLRRSVVALEQTTGLAAEGFQGDRPTAAH